MRLLVVEDEPKLAGLLRRGLEEDGYAVDVTGSGAEAVWFATEHAYDAILLDLGLEDVDGIEVCRRLRAGSRWSPIIVVTARERVEDRVSALDAGADDYLAKPYSFAELLARIRALVRRGQPPRPVVLAIGGLELDPGTRAVARDGTPIAVTSKEFSLLEYLMRNPGRVLDRAELIEHVWDFAFAGDPRIVDVYVRYLRQKIDEPFGTSSIETVRGKGYRLKAAT
ncbi:response regulator transcription factor [Aquihabitans sp. McL0605]|uniref:response regulator transcription factor n=1 Tax=Aquihabitans sp. McL0605 TaxID=3415671 RepID=UPI003CEB32CE